MNEMSNRENRNARRGSAHGREISVFARLPPARKALKIVLLLALFGAGLFLWSTDHINVNVTALRDNEPKTLWSHLPSTAKVGDPVALTVECWDYCERLACGYDGVVHFTSTDPLASLPDAYEFQPSGPNQGLVESRKIPWGDGGMKKFEITFQTVGFHYLFVEDPELGYIAMSNPILVYEGKIPLKLYWGDIHAHQSIMCDGSGYPEEALQYAKDIARLDFATYSQHDHFISPLHTGITWKATWEYSKSVVNHWNEAPDFATLLAYEYRGGFLTNNRLGDLVIYSRGTDVPYYSGAMSDWETPDLLFEALGTWKQKTDTELMAIPHHPPHNGFPGMTFDWSYYDPNFIRLVEVYSVHGSSECMESQGNPFPLLGGNDGRKVEINKTGYYVRDALAMGYKIGFMGSGDSHDGYIGHSISHTEANHLLQQPYSWGALPHNFRTQHHYPLGLSGVFAPSLSRENIYDAMWNRACYAARGVSRTFVNFTINGQMVGFNESEIQVPSSTTPREIRIQAYAGAGTPQNAIQSIEIFKNNVLWQVVKPNTRSVEEMWTDSQPLAGIAYDQTAGEIRADGKFYINEIADIPAVPSTLNSGGADVYYARVLESEGGAVWAGPFWVSA